LATWLLAVLDVTRANLFFAKGVAIVEGDAENILLLVFADLLGSPLSAVKTPRPRSLRRCGESLPEKQK